jgi:hypothetical protein
MVGTAHPTQEYPQCHFERGQRRESLLGADWQYGWLCWHCGTVVSPAAAVSVNIADVLTPEGSRRIAHSGAMGHGLRTSRATITPKVIP